MAATPLFTCTCGVQKKTSNHWILAITSAHDVKFMPWDANLALEDNVIVLCGERCAAALLSRCLGDWKASEYTSTPVSASIASAKAAAAATSAVA
ncbi:MAG TPA: hypothetical protein VHZ25_02685 [Acidobacteriaceae bacterium]|jgi:hypothetical protein|nr:hypothetical protein [Acidobacteriaceae bacterium]